MLWGKSSSPSPLNPLSSLSFFFFLSLPHLSLFATVSHCSALHNSPTSPPCYFAGSRSILRVFCHESSEIQQGVSLSTASSSSRHFWAPLLLPLLPVSSIASSSPIVSDVASTIPITKLPPPLFQSLASPPPNRSQHFFSSSSVLVLPLFLLLSGVASIKQL
ncbi:hypothetical protein PIB30_050937 [Stylosanthes scabra]|uniref:Uncharacterized protein n=1 Tax=Stylosanthes scabra TaxID=79078 RepID=A0ABU6SIR7_9FABA|nr:hypothetical protein [Stylosanthes scabra]